MSANPDHDDGLLLELKRRRAELRTSMGVLERALASATGTSAAATWVAHVRDALRALSDDFVQHVAITEGEDGLYADLAQHSPRLEHAVARLVEEHAEVGSRLEDLLALAAGDAVEGQVPQVRTAGTDLLGALMRHRQHGADLVFEAYDLDIGGET